MSREARGE